MTYYTAASSLESLHKHATRAQGYSGSCTVKRILADLPISTHPAILSSALSKIYGLRSNGRERSAVAPFFSLSLKRTGPSLASSPTKWSKWTPNVRYGLRNVMLTNCWADDQMNESQIVPENYVRLLDKQVVNI